MIHAAGSPGPGVSARPKALVVLVVLEAPDAGCGGFLKEDQRARDVRAQERLPVVRAGVGRFTEMSGTTGHQDCLPGHENDHGAPRGSPASLRQSAAWC
ncbi:MAG: hypothetical protein ACRDRK_15235 [Pseudonocardia sp.]